MKEQDKEYLLQFYGALYGPDAGAWNTSVKSKYLEYRLAAFFEEHFEIRPGDDVCNIGIGAGFWDRYLSFRLRGGRLTSIDIDADCCRQLALGLENEQNPQRVDIVQADVLQLENFDGKFDLVTLVGSTRTESGQQESILQKAVGFLKPGGSFFYQTLDGDEEKEMFFRLCEQNGWIADEYLLDTAYGFRAQYFKAVKPARKAN